MTFPNKLTLTRLFAAPLVFLSWYIFFHLGYAPRAGTIVIWILFGMSEVTDILDGHFARIRQQVSDVGKLMDPFSDVFLRVTYFICFMESGLMPVWTLAVILWRELAIMFLRMLIAKEGTAMAANKAGKIKSTLYFISGFVGLLTLAFRAWIPDWKWMLHAEKTASAFFVLAALASAVSFISYFRFYIQSETHKKFISE